MFTDIGVEGPRDGIKKRSRRRLESCGREGNTPVDETQIGPSGILSTAGHVEPGGKQGGPPPKAKYSLATDSEQVP